MGMYTEFVAAVELKGRTPKEIIETLKYMINVNDKDREITELSHELFKCARWRYMLNMDSDYFTGVSHTTLKKDKYSDNHFLTIRCNLKNYDSEIEKFLNWIEPYVYADDIDFVGYTRYEECQHPTLIYYDADKCKFI